MNEHGEIAVLRLKLRILERKIQDDVKKRRLEIDSLDQDLIQLQHEIEQLKKQKQERCET